MAAVAKAPFFAERIAADPQNGERLAALDPAVFIATMKRWNSFFYYREDCTVAGVADTDLSRLSLPTLLFEGGDDVHPAEVSAAMARLMPRASLLPSAWTARDWMDRFTGRSPGSVFDLYPKLAPAIFDFIGGF